MYGHHLHSHIHNLPCRHGMYHLYVSRTCYIFAGMVCTISMSAEHVISLPAWYVPSLCQQNMLYPCRHGMYHLYVSRTCYILAGMVCTISMSAEHVISCEHNMLYTVEKLWSYCFRQRNDRILHFKVVKM